MDIEKAESEFRSAIQNIFYDIQRRAAMDATALGTSDLKSRLQLRGEKSDGSQFKPYSQAKVPRWYFRNRSRTGSGKAMDKLKKQKKWFVSYADWRKANNLRTDKKDFTFTGEMMRSIRPREVSVGGGVVSMEIGSTDKKNAQKIEWLTQQQGELLNLSKAEESDMTDEFGRGIERELNKLLL